MMVLPSKASSFQLNLDAYFLFHFSRSTLLCARLSLPAVQRFNLCISTVTNHFECYEQTESICFYISNGYVSIDTIPNQSQRKMYLTTGFEVELCDSHVVIIVIIFVN